MEPYVWLFDRDGQGSRRKAPKNVFEETDFYTISMPNGERNLVLEHGLQELEDQLAKVRDEKLRQDLPVTADEGAYVVAFMIAMSFRTKAHRHRRRQEWSRVALSMEKAQKRKDEHGRSPTVRFSFSQNPHGPSLSLAEVQKLADESMQHMLPVEISTYLPLVAGMDMMVMRTDDPIGFITSDDPCIWLNERANAGPPVMRDLGVFGILMPLSPQQMLFLNPLQSCYGRLKALGQVDELNRMTRVHANSEIVVCRNTVRREWFEDEASRFASA